MSAPKFTPGPWVWRGVFGSSELHSAHGCVLDYSHYEGMWFSYDADKETREANARLIAAAPKLYGVLEELANAADESLSCDHNELCPFARRLRDAVIKARTELAAAVQP